MYSLALLMLSFIIYVWYSRLWTLLQGLYVWFFKSFGRKAIWNSWNLCAQFISLISYYFFEYCFLCMCIFLIYLMYVYFSQISCVFCILCKISLIVLSKRCRQEKVWKILRNRSQTLYSGALSILPWSARELRDQVITVTFLVNRSGYEFYR